MAFDREGTEALKHLADEVEQERKTKGHTPFDDIPESEGEHSTREDAQGREASSDDEVSPAETIGYTGQPRTPGL